MYKILIVSVLGAVAVGAGAVYLLLANQAVETPVTIEQVTTGELETSPQTSEPVSGTDSLEGLLARAENLECTITYSNMNNPADTVTGTYFTSAGKMRGDFILPDLAPGSVSSMIMDETALYSWSMIGGDTYGMKIDLATLAAQKQSETAPETNEPVDLDAPVEYECKPWVAVDQSIFIPPSDVLFTDYANIMSAGMQYGTVYEGAVMPGADSPCALCDQVAPGEGQDQCRANFNCQ